MIDPRFNILVFPKSKRAGVKSTIKKLVESVEVVRNHRNQENERLVDRETSPLRESGKKSKYIYYESDNIASIVDPIDKMLEDYERASGDCVLKNPLEFWKKHEHMFSSLARLAKKYLSVQASSAACERMFSLSGHIFSCKFFL